jgi:hypothetical protein
MCWISSQANNEWISISLILIKNNLVPEYVNDEITYNRDETIRILRYKDDFSLPTYKKTYTQNSMWNDVL